jgi:hypothetical protein
MARTYGGDPAFSWYPREVTSGLNDKGKAVSRLSIFAVASFTIWTALLYQARISFGHLLMGSSAKLMKHLLQGCRHLSRKAMLSGH